MMLGLLLARAGVEVLVLEKHGDFLRDFRGDTVHPSTLEVMHELGLLGDFLRRPHDEARQITGYVAGEPVIVADFAHLKTSCPFVALMPQWEFLVTQSLQVFIQNRVISRVLSSQKPLLALPWPVRLLRTFPILRRIPARLIGIGIRPEHVKTGEKAEPAPRPDYHNKVSGRA